MPYRLSFITLFFAIKLLGVSLSTSYGAVDFARTCIKRQEHPNGQITATYSHLGTNGTSLSGPVTYFVGVNYIHSGTGRFNPFHWSSAFLQLLHALRTERRPIRQVFFSGTFEASRLGDNGNEWTRTFTKPMLKILEERQVGRMMKWSVRSSVYKF